MPTLDLIHTYLTKEFFTLMVIRQLDIVINVHLSSQRSFEKKNKCIYLGLKINFACVVSILN